MENCFHSAVTSNRMAHDTSNFKEQSYALPYHNFVTAFWPNIKKQVAVAMVH